MVINHYTNWPPAYVTLTLEGLQEGDKVIMAPLTPFYRDCVCINFHQFTLDADRSTDLTIATAEPIPLDTPESGLIRIGSMQPFKTYEYVSYSGSEFRLRHSWGYDLPPLQRLRHEVRREQYRDMWIPYLYSPHSEQGSLSFTTRYTEPRKFYLKVNEIVSIVYLDSQNLTLHRDSLPMTRRPSDDFEDFWPLNNKSS